MTSREREVLDHLRHLAGSVRRPTGGATQSASYAGYIGHSVDAQVLTAFVSKILYALCVPLEVLLEDDLPTAENLLAIANVWLENRERDDWTMQGARLEQQRVETEIRFWTRGT